MKRVSYNMDSYRGESMIKEMKHLISELNVASDMYHNTSNTIMSDKSWDIKFDRLKELEKKTGIVLSNSPSVNVGYEVKSKLGKVKHEYSLRSLGKTQDKNELNKFINNKKSIGMLKLDGLTTDIIYENGELIEGSTRGNGLVGENITHNVKTYTNIPKTIKHKGRVHVVGESIITYDVFDEINKNKEIVKIDHIIYNSILKPEEEGEIVTSLYNSNYDVKILGYTYDDMENKSNIDIDLITHKVNIIDNKQ